MTRSPFDNDEFLYEFFEAVPMCVIIAMYASSKMLRDRVALYADQLRERVKRGALVPSRSAPPCYVVLQCRRREFFGVLAAGPRHSLATSRDGLLASFGHGSYGKLGNTVANSSACPRLVRFFGSIRVVQVAAGGRHSCALSASGRCFSWGANDRCQLGLGKEAPGCVDSPQSVRCPDVVEIACGDEHTLFLAGDGTVRACGSRKVAGLPNLDLEGEDACVALPTTLPRLADAGVFVSRIAANGGHSLALDDRGRVYSWGKGDGGRLGHGDDQPKLEPTLVKALMREKILSIDCGAESSCAIAAPAVSVSKHHKKRPRKRFFWWGVENGLSYITDYLADDAWRRPTLCPGLLPPDEDADEATATKSDIAFVALGGGIAGAVVVNKGDGKAYQVNRDVASGRLRRRPLNLPRPCLAAACADHHFLCLLNDGSVVVAGCGNDGRLGLGEHVNSATLPTAITTLPWLL